MARENIFLGRSSPYFIPPFSILSRNWNISRSFLYSQENRRQQGLQGENSERRSLKDTKSVFLVGSVAEKSPQI